MKIIYGDTCTFDEESTLESFITMSTATKESTINGSTVHSIQAPPALACDGRDDDEDEFELIEGGSFIEDGPSVQGTGSTEDTIGRADAKGRRGDDRQQRYKVYQLQYRVIIHRLLEQNGVDGC